MSFFSGWWWCLRSHYIVPMVKRELQNHLNWLQKPVLPANSAWGGAPQQNNPYNHHGTINHVSKSMIPPFTQPRRVPNQLAPDMTASQQQPRKPNAFDGKSPPGRLKPEISCSKPSWRWVGRHLGTSGGCAEVLSVSLSQYVPNLIVTFLVTISNLELRNMYLIWISWQVWWLRWVEIKFPRSPK